MLELPGVGAGDQTVLLEEQQVLTAEPSVQPLAYYIYVCMCVNMCVCYI